MKSKGVFLCVGGENQTCLQDPDPRMPGRQGERADPSPGQSEMGTCVMG